MKYPKPRYVLVTGRPITSKEKLKVVLVGDSSVLGQVHNENFPGISTIGIDFKSISDQETGTQFQVWDTIGHERFRTITSAYYRNTDIMLFYSSVSMLGNINQSIEYLDGKNPTLYEVEYPDDPKVNGEVKLKKVELPLQQVGAVSSADDDEKSVELVKILSSAAQHIQVAIAAGAEASAVAAKKKPSFFSQLFKKKEDEPAVASSSATATATVSNTANVYAAKQAEHAAAATSSTSTTKSDVVPPSEADLLPPSYQQLMLMSASSNALAATMNVASALAMPHVPDEELVGYPALPDADLEDELNAGSRQPAR